MVLRHLPFKIESQNIHTFINKVSTGLTETHQIQMINVSIDCVHLITSCLNPNRLNRIAFPAHPWISRKGRKPVDFDLTDNAAILHRAAHIFCQKFKFQVPKTPRPHLTSWATLQNIRTKERVVASIWLLNQSRLRWRKHPWDTLDLKKRLSSKNRAHESPRLSQKCLEKSSAKWNIWKSTKLKIIMIF